MPSFERRMEELRELGLERHLTAIEVARSTSVGDIECGTTEEDLEADLQQQ